MVKIRSILCILGVGITSASLCYFMHPNSQKTPEKTKNDETVTKRNIKKRHIINGIPIIDEDFKSHKEKSAEIYKDLEQADPKITVLVNKFYIEENNEFGNSYTIDQDVHFCLKTFSSGYTVNHELYHIVDNTFSIIEDPKFIDVLKRDEVVFSEDEIAELWVSLAENYINYPDFLKQTKPNTFVYIDTIWLKLHNSENAK